MTSLIIQLHFQQLAAIILLYSGPDQILPLLSILGAIIGFLLIWWQRLVPPTRKMQVNCCRQANPHAPKEVASFMPMVSQGVQWVQSKDVCFDSRGLIHVLDRTRGLHILERT